MGEMERGERREEEKKVLIPGTPNLDIPIAIGPEPNRI